MCLAQQRQQIDRRRLPPFLLAGLDRCGRGGGIGDDVPFDALEVRLLAAGDEAWRLLARHVAVEPLERRQRAGGPLVAVEHVRAGADVFVDLLVRIGLARSRSGMMKQTLAVGLPSPCASSGNGSLQAEDECAVISGTEFVERGLDALGEAVTLHPALNRRDAVGCADRRAVVELEPVAQPEAPCQAVIGDLVALAHLRLRREVAVPPIQRVPDHVAEVAGDRGRGPDRVGVLQIAFGYELQRLRRRLGDRRARQAGRRCNGGTGRGEHFAPFHLFCPIATSYCVSRSYAADTASGRSVSTLTPHSVRRIPGVRRSWNAALAASSAPCRIPCGVCDSMPGLRPPEAS